MALAEALNTSKGIALMKKAEEKEAALHHLIDQEDSPRFCTLMPSKTFRHNRKKFR